MTAGQAHRGPSSGAGGGWALAGLAAVAVAVATTGIHLGHTAAGLPAPPTNPLTLGKALATGTVTWTTPDTVATAVLATATLAALFGLLMGVARIRGGRSRVDTAARQMGRGRDIRRITVPFARATARRLGLPTFRGLPIGRAVAGGQPLVSGAEDCMVTFAGPRVGWKTTAIVIPRILTAPPDSPVLVTGNKPDACQATRGLRGQHGQVWVFDPQQIAAEPPAWWWNPLSYVTTATRAHRLAGVFTAAGRDPTARDDNYFGPEGVTLLGNLLLAAARSGQELTAVYRWLLNPGDDEPARILRATGSAVAADLVAALAAEAAQAVMDSPTKERGGIYGSGRRVMRWMLSETTLPWITSTGHGTRRHFSPEAFVRGGHTLYSLSQEGAGSAGPLVTALTVAVLDAAESYAVACGGRLPAPLVVEGDEAANSCADPELPARYTHYGSRGILMNTVLQTPAQGVRVWGDAGMEVLISSASVLLYGGGIREDRFLDRLSKLIGSYQLTSSSVSHSRAGSSVQTSVTDQRILDLGVLAELPEDRMVVLHSAGRACLARKVPWMDGKHAQAVRASQAAPTPTAGRPRVLEHDVPPAGAAFGPRNPWTGTG